MQGSWGFSNKKYGGCKKNFGVEHTGGGPKTLWWSKQIYGGKNTIFWGTNLRVRLKKCEYFFWMHLDKLLFIINFVCLFKKMGGGYCSI